MLSNNGRFVCRIKEDNMGKLAGTELPSASAPVVLISLFLICPHTDISTAWYTNAFE